MAKYAQHIPQELQSHALEESPLPGLRKGEVSDGEDVSAVRPAL
jgi:hypothetical protein